MIPYIQIPPLAIFGTTIFAFEVLLALAFLVGAQLSARRAVKVGISPTYIYDGAILTVIFGFFGAHLLHVLAYEPEALRKSIWSIFDIGAGLSSFGGFLGGGIAVAIYRYRKKIPYDKMADVAAFGVIPAFFVGRIGCATAHDHPGRLTTFPLAVAFPGGARHDLGLYETILALGLTLLLYLYFDRVKDLRDGLAFAWMLILYGVARFFLDFLRATDVPKSDARYFGLTPAQYFSVLFVAFGVYSLFRIIRLPRRGPSL